MVLCGSPSVSAVESIAAHGPWAEELIEKYKTFDKENIDAIIEKEVGDVFVKVLEHAGVYKRTEEGKAAFLKFAEAVNQ